MNAYFFLLGGGGGGLKRPNFNLHNNWTAPIRNLESSLTANPQDTLFFYKNQVYKNSIKNKNISKAHKSGLSLTLLLSGYFFPLSIGGGGLPDPKQIWLITRLTDLSQKWVNTLWKGVVLTILKSTGSFWWVICEMTNLRLKSRILKNWIFFELLGSQTSDKNYPVLFKIVRTSTSHRVLNHFCGWSRSWAIHDLTSADFATDFRETPSFWGGARG